MQNIKVVPIPTAQVRAYQAGAPDANNMPAEHHAKGGGPCRHCLQPIEAGDAMLVLGYRPFDSIQPYAEVGPIFLHAKPCAAYDTPTELPRMFADWGSGLVIVKGYGNDDRIRYESARVVPASALDQTCKALLANPDVAYLHVRAAQTNCYQCRIERA